MQIKQKKPHRTLASCLTQSFYDDSNGSDNVEMTEPGKMQISSWFGYDTFDGMKQKPLTVCL